MVPVQNDFVAQLVQTSAQVGHVVWFTVEAHEVPQAEWVQAITTAGLAAYGLPSGVSPAVAYRRALRRLQREGGGKTLMRLVARESGRTTHHWIRETVAHGQVTFTPIAAVTRDRRSHAVTTTVLADLTADQQDALTRLPTFLRQAETTYTAGDRRRQIRRWLDGVGALPMTIGSAVFVPDTGSGLVTALQRAGTDLGVQLMALPLARSRDVVDTLVTNLDTLVTRQTAALLESVKTAQAAGHELTDAQKARLVDQFRALDARVQQYAALFGQQLDNLTMQIDVARQAVRGALQ